MVRVQAAMGASDLTIAGYRLSTGIKRSLFGYTDPMSVAAGESLRVMVSSESGESTYRADLVR